MKKAIKAVKKSVAEWAKAADMKWLLQKAYSTIDKAQQKNILHKNNAARKKSRLNNMVKIAS
jgi:small subunit ribosomal protein S20